MTEELIASMVYDHFRDSIIDHIEYHADEADFTLDESAIDRIKVPVIALITGHGL